MKYILYVLILFSVFTAVAQNRTQKSISGSDISTININGVGVFKISIESNTSENITIESKIEGENSEHVVLITETKNKTLFVNAKYQPLFIDANDKLSAQKVISIELLLKIPINKTVYVSSDMASIFVKGEYKDVTVELINGACVLNDFVGNATVNTIQGDIEVFTNRAKLDVFTKHGVLTLETLSQGNRLLSLYSINGNITVIKSQ